MLQHQPYRLRLQLGINLLRHHVILLDSGRDGIKPVTVHSSQLEPWLEQHGGTPNHRTTQHTSHWIHHR